MIYFSDIDISLHLILLLLSQAKFQDKLIWHYRESYFIPESKEDLYFGEALLDAFKTSYKTQAQRQVKILPFSITAH